MADDFGLNKPTVKDKLKAAMRSARASNDLEMATQCQDLLEGKLSLERIKRRVKSRESVRLRNCVSKCLRIPVHSIQTLIKTFRVIERLSLIKIITVIVYLLCMHTGLSCCIALYLSIST